MAKENEMSDTSGNMFPIQGTKYEGISYRQWLIGQALNGMLANDGREADFDGFAADAVKFADAILATPEEPHDN